MNERFKSNINIVTDKWGEMIIKDDNGNCLSGWFRKGKERECRNLLLKIRKEQREYRAPNLFQILNGLID